MTAELEWNELARIFQDNHSSCTSLQGNHFLQESCKILQGNHLVSTWDYNKKN